MAEEIDKSIKVFGKLNIKTKYNFRLFHIFCDENNYLVRGLKKELNRKTYIDKLYELYGNEAFLIKEEKLFPIINLNTGQIDQRLIEYAYIRVLELCLIDLNMYRSYLDIIENYLKIHKEYMNFTNSIYDEEYGRQILLIELLKEMILLKYT